MDLDVFIDAFYLKGVIIGLICIKELLYRGLELLLNVMFGPIVKHCIYLANN